MSCRVNRVKARKLNLVNMLLTKRSSFERGEVRLQHPSNRRNCRSFRENGNFGEKRLRRVFSSHLVLHLSSQQNLVQLLLPRFC